MMEPIFTDLDETGRRIAKEWDKRDNRGVLYCGRCGAPKEVCLFAEDGSLVKQYPRECDCEAVRRQVVEAKARLAAKRAVLPEKYTRHFSDSDGRAGKSEKVARRFVDNFQKVKGMEVNGILYWGDVRKGKTFLAACIATELAERGNRVTIMSMAEFMAQAIEHGLERDTWVKSLLRCDLLVLDDLGVERSTETAYEALFHLIDGANREGIPLVVTTNLSPQQMMQAGDMKAQRVCSRIIERCYASKVESSKSGISMEAMREAAAIYES